MDEDRYLESSAVVGRVLGVVIDHAHRPGNGERQRLFDRVVEAFTLAEETQDLSPLNEALAAYGNHVGLPF